MSDDSATKPSMVERLQAQRATHKQRRLVERVAFVVAGFTVLFAGVAMMVLPGPAFVVIPVGLAMLSLEFAWAARLLDVALVQAEKAQAAAKETTKTQRILVAVATALAVAAVVAAVLVWGIPDWVPVIGEWF